MNKIFLHGNIGRDPELTFSNQDIAICKFTIATKNGEDKDPTWHNVVAFKKTAETINKYFKKGKEIIIEGKQDNQKYEKDGETKYSSVVICYSFDFCGKKDSSEESDLPF